MKARVDTYVSKTVHDSIEQILASGLTVQCTRPTTAIGYLAATPDWNSSTSALVVRRRPAAVY